LFLRLSGSHAVAIAFAVPLAVLLTTVRTSVGFWDTGDLQTVAWIGGIPYPTGYPLYVIVGWLWTHAVPFASVAARLNALSAVSIAAAAATVCGLALLFEVSAAFAVLGGWLFAFAHTVWYRATYADAHPVGFAVALLAVSFAVRWAVRGERRFAPFALLAGGVALALDNTTVLILIGGAFLVAARRLPLRSSLAALAAAILIIVAAYAYLPLRSAQVSAARLDPTLALGIEPGRPFWDDHHPATIDGFRELVAGTRWSTGETLAHIGTVDAIRKTEQRFVPDLDGDLPQGLALAGLLGIAFLAVSEPLVVLALVFAAGLPALFGGSYRAEADPERYIFMTYAVLALGIALAADRAVRAVTPARAVVAHRLALGLLLLAIASQLWNGGDLFAMRDDGDAARLGVTVAKVTHDDAIVVVAWDWATALAYRAYVDRAFGRRIVVCGFPEDYEKRYRDWARARQVAVVADDPPVIAGFTARRLIEGKPGVYQLVPR